jgi:chromosome segregation ATPase
MSASDAEITDLIQQHQAIQAHMKFLTKALSTLSTRPIHLITYLTPLRDRIAHYRWSLYDFKEAIRRQSQLDERILRNSNEMKEILKEYQEIRDRIDSAIKLAEDAVNRKMTQEKLIGYSCKISEAVDGICRILEQHMDREDNLLVQRRKTCV